MIRPGGFSSDAKGFVGVTINVTPVGGAYHPDAGTTNLKSVHISVVGADSFRWIVQPAGGGGGIVYGWVYPGGLSDSFQVLLTPNGRTLTVEAYRGTVGVWNTRGDDAPSTATLLLSRSETYELLTGN
jgi:hypothetical protein